MKTAVKKTYVRVIYDGITYEVQSEEGQWLNEALDYEALMELCDREHYHILDMVDQSGDGEEIPDENSYS
jgi:hypothetical protein